MTQTHSRCQKMSSECKRKLLGFLKHMFNDFQPTHVETKQILPGHQDGRWSHVVSKQQHQAEPGTGHAGAPVTSRGWSLPGARLWPRSLVDCCDACERSGRVPEIR